MRDAEQALLRHQLGDVPRVAGSVGARRARRRRGAFCETPEPSRGTAAARASAGSPYRRMVAERHRRPAPVRRRLGKLRATGLQVADAAVGRVHLARAAAASSSCGRSSGRPRQADSGSDAAVDDPLADARERHAHQPAAAFARAARERDARRRTPSGSRSRNRSRTPAAAAACSPHRPAACAMPLTACTMLSKPRRLAPRPALAPRAERGADDARPQRGQRLGREAARGERAGPVRLREHVRLARERAQARRRPRCVRRSRRAESLPMPVSSSTRPESGRCAALILSTSAPCSARLLRAGRARRARA